jgi:hypothetical protein
LNKSDLTKTEKVECFDSLILAFRRWQTIHQTRQDRAKKRMTPSKGSNWLPKEAMSKPKYYRKTNLYRNRSMVHIRNHNWAVGQPGSESWVIRARESMQNAESLVNHLSNTGQSAVPILSKPGSGAHCRSGRSLATGLIGEDGGAGQGVGLVE